MPSAYWFLVALTAFGAIFAGIAALYISPLRHREEWFVNHSFVTRKLTDGSYARGILAHRVTAAGSEYRLATEEECDKYQRELAW